MTAGQVQISALFLEGNSSISLKTLDCDFDLVNSDFENLFSRNSSGGTKEEYAGSSLPHCL